MKDWIKRNRFGFAFLSIAMITTIALAATATRIKTDSVIVGSKTSTANKSLLFEKGDGVQPGFRYDQTKNKLQFAHDGSTYRDIGTGGGGGGGENFNNAFTADDNANAEDGTTGWTASAGTFETDEDDPLEGEQSFEWTPAAQNDTLDSPVLDVDKDIFKGRSCQVSIEYIGGDGNLSLKVINGDDEELASLELQEHTISAVETTSFNCPSDADIVADSDKGDLRLRIENTGASASALIKFDKSYVGTLIGLSETTLPDVLSAKIDGTGGASVSITSQSSEFIQSVGYIVTGRFTVTYKTGIFTQLPAIQVTPNTSAHPSQRIAVIQNETLTGFEVSLINNTGTLVNDGFEITVTKQGADAKQAVQVYKSIPKVSENVNEFSARIQNNGTASILSQNVTWIDSVNQTGTGSVDVTFVSGVFSETPSCSGTIIDTNNNLGITSPSSSSITTNSRNVDNSAADENFDLHCTKQSTDYKLPTVQPIVVGQVTNSYAESASRNVRVESCRVNNDGTASTAPNRLCDQWINSATRNGDNTVTIAITPGTFSTIPNCTCTALNNSFVCMTDDSFESTTQLNVLLRNSSTDVRVDADFSIMCMGQK